jgi:23S rRNA (cytidine1920-2'-O)/16S rRNA (cytidine1409-2'-O)-methyltransferase
VKERADKVLADLGLVSSRSQAKSIIDHGDVTVNGMVVKKASELIDPTANIQVTSEQYVGRGALKLEKALEEFEVETSGKIFLDVGASTGGFTEVLLKHGADKVYAIDVGHNQLAAKIKNDPRVINLERTNIKDLTTLPELADGAVMDLSFISIIKVLKSVHHLLKPQAPLIALVKPQFEAGLERLPKDGVVKEKKIQEEILQEVIAFATTNGWQHLKSIDSPIAGKSGNHEFLCWFKKS